MKDFIAFMVLVLAALTTLGVFLFPLIVSMFTGNWWFFLMFIVSWIPTVGVIIFWSAVISVVSEWL
jgi:hypothetical protein